MSEGNGKAPLLEACIAVLAAGGVVSFPYRPTSDDWLMEAKAYSLPDAEWRFVLYDPYSGLERFGKAEDAAARLLQLVSRKDP